MKHCMLDLETWGTKPGCAIRSIGAVCFELEGDVGSKYSANISDESCQAWGLTVDPKTKEWWEHPDRVTANKVLSQAQQPLLHVISTFESFFLRNRCEYIWSHGATFDVVVWEAVCHIVGVTFPWNFRNVRDTRTVYHVLKYDPTLSVVAEFGTQHVAIDDAMKQVLDLQKAFQGAVR